LIELERANEAKRKPTSTEDRKRLILLAQQAVENYTEQQLSSKHTMAEYDEDSDNMFESCFVDGDSTTTQQMLKCVSYQFASQSGDTIFPRNVLLGTLF